MAKIKTNKNVTQSPNRPSKPNRDDIVEVMDHYQAWTQDMRIRMFRKNGWNDVTDAYWGRLPDKSEWPYQSRIVDPRIRTTIIEKTGRILNSRLRGRLVPRKGATSLQAKLNNALIDYQWDTANHGGSMHTKLSITDQDTRLYASKFGYVYWRNEKDSDGKLIFDGNEYEPLDIRDCGIDYGATHIRDAKWFQMRRWRYLEDLEEHNKTSRVGARFQNLDVLRDRANTRTAARSNRRSTSWVSRVKQNKGLEDRLGRDLSFPVVEIVTEFRRDVEITFAPQFNLILRKIKNPYLHGKIPIVQLRYQPLQDDVHGESEVEPVMGLWKAIQAVMCGFLDEMNIKMRPPLKIVEGQARVETIVYGAEAQWMVNSQDAVQEMRSNGEAMRWFQTTYGALVSAYNTAMGELSQGVSTINPFEAEKTATEVRATTKQQNIRDQRNQNDLSEFIEDVIKMWTVNNRQFLFTDESQKQHVVRILGRESLRDLQKAGLDEMEVPEEAMQSIAEIIQLQEGNLSDDDIVELYESAKVPRFPVEKSGEEGVELTPKLNVDEGEDGAALTLVPEDVDGEYDYIADVKSMASGAREEMLGARQRAIELLTSNENIVVQLQGEGFRPSIKEALSAHLEDLGLKDADRFFESLPKQTAQAAAGVSTDLQVGGLPGLPQASAGTGNIHQPVAQPPGQAVPDGGRLSQALQG